MAGLRVQIYIRCNGVEVPIETIGKLISHDGWGMAPLHQITEQGPMQDGETRLDVRLDPRLGTFVFLLPEYDLTYMYREHRQEILSYFPPNLPIYVVFEYEETYRREIECYYESDLSLPWESETMATQKFAVTLRASDPTFFDPAAAGFSFSLGGGGVGFAVPMAVPCSVGSSTADYDGTVSYLGRWKAFPIIRIMGPITNCVITNTETGEILNFTGYTIAAGNWYEIDLRYGYKTVVNQAGTNKISELSADSDLATFHIAEARPGEVIRPNIINITGTGITADSCIQLVCYMRYLGV